MDLGQGPGPAKDRHIAGAGWPHLLRLGIVYGMSALQDLFDLLGKVGGFELSGRSAAPPGGLLLLQYHPAE
jgi:hypothetical protein